MFIITNLLGIMWSLIGVMIGLGVGRLLGAPPGVVSGLGTGITIFVCDFSYRFLQGETLTVRQLIRPSDGGHVIFIPCWIQGLLMCIITVLDHRL